MAIEPFGIKPKCARCIERATVNIEYFHVGFPNEKLEANLCDLHLNKLLQCDVKVVFKQHYDMKTMVKI